MEMSAEDIVAIYRKRWEIELLFKQIKQNFPLRYFYGESANAIKIQIWITLIANLLLMVLKKRIKRSWSWSVLVSGGKITVSFAPNKPGIPFFLRVTVRCNVAWCIAIGKC